VISSPAKLMWDCLQFITGSAQTFSVVVQLYLYLAHFPRYYHVSSKFKEIT